MMTTTVFWTNPEEGYLPQLLTDRIAGNAGRYHRKTDRVAASRSQFHSFLVIDLDEDPNPTPLNVDSAPTY